LSLWSTCAGVQEGLATALCGPWQCRGAEEALGVFWLACSDTLRVRLCQLGPASPRCTFSSLHGSKGGRLEGLTRGPRSPRAPGGQGGVCILVSRPVRDAIRGAVDGATPKGLCRDAPEPRWLRACLLAPMPWMALQTGWKLRAWALACRHSVA
jgi:hypothetical protein